MFELAQKNFVVFDFLLYKQFKLDWVTDKNHKFSYAEFVLKNVYLSIKVRLRQKIEKKNPHILEFLLWNFYLWKLYDKGSFHTICMELFVGNFLVQSCMTSVFCTWKSTHDVFSKCGFS